jgi:hypothetical protein
METRKRRKVEKGMMDKKATGNDGVSRDVLKVVGEDGLRIMTQHIWNWRVAHKYQ